MTGSRHHPDWLWVWDILDGIQRGQPITEVVVGDASGVDAYAFKWALEHGVMVTRYAADWDTHGRAAGPIRNQEMVDTKPDLVIGFPQGPSKGTRDCLRRAAGIPMLVFE